MGVRNRRRSARWRALIDSGGTAGSGPPSSGNIVSATINADGYTINIRLTGSLTVPNTNFGAYALDPDGTPKLTLSCSHGGYSESGGVAVADTKTRTIYGTLPHRDVATYGATQPDPNKLTEVDNGDGTITVRIALSETVFATISADGGDTAITLDVAAGWRTGESAQTGISVTNNSAVLTPRPGHRWADVPSRRVTGTTIRASLVGLSFHPMNLRGLAAVKFTMTDGTTTKTAWATGLTTSTTYGGNDRLYEVDLDVSTGTPLVAGLVRIDAELYPWIGAMRSTDNGTGMTGLAQVAKETPSQRPDCVAYDPAGTRYRTGADFIHISSAGTTTAASVTVAADAATAKAGTHAADFSTALHAAYLANRAISGLTRPVDGMVFTLEAGTHNINPTNKNFLGIACTGVETWATLSGDLTDADPSQNCILEAVANTCRPRGTQHWRFSNMSVYCGGPASGARVLWSTDSVFQWWDMGSIRRGSVGQELANAATHSGFTTPSGFWTSWATGSKMWKYGSGWKPYGFERNGLVRNCQTSRMIGAALSLGNTFIQHLDTFITAGNGDQFLHTAPYTTLTDLGAAQDCMQIGNDMRSTEGRSFDAAYVNAATGGTAIRAPNIIAFPYVSYQFHVNNLLERYHNTGASVGVNIWGGVGEQNDREAYACLFEGNTLVGQRNSFMFCKPACNSGVGQPITETQKTNWASVIAFRNNAYDKTGEETDREAADPALTSYRTNNALPTQLGMSAYRRGCDCIVYGTDCEGNVNFSRLINGANGDIDNYQLYLGRNSVLLKTGVAAANAYKNDVLYTSEQSMHGPITNGAAAGAGQGDYHPQSVANGYPADSLLVGRATRANLDRTLDNVARTVPFNTGAL